MVPWWYPPIGRPIGSPPLDTHITWPWPPGPAVSYQSFGAASVLGGNTPRALEGQGHTAIRGRPIGGPSGLGQTVGHAPNARHRSSLAVYLRLQWARPSLWCRVLATAFRPRSGAAPPGSWQLSRRDAVVRAVLCWRRLRRLPRRRPPGSGRLFRFLAAIRVDGYGLTPGQKHSHRRCPVPQPTKPPRPLLVR